MMGDVDARIRKAIAGRRLIELRYNGATRIAEPHDYGIQRAHERLLIYQLSGPAKPGQSPVGWRWLEVPKIEEVTVLNETFKGSRAESHQSHNEWESVYARVK